MTDLKQHLKLREGKPVARLFSFINGDMKRVIELTEYNSELKECFEFDSLQWNNFFTYKPERNSLQNFMVYRIANSFNLYERGFNDCDITSPVIEWFFEKLMNLPNVVHVQNGKDQFGNVINKRVFCIRLIDGKYIYLETDMANSLMMDLANFMRYIISKNERITEKTWYRETYMRIFGLNNPNEGYRNFYFYLYLGKLFKEVSKGNDYECLKLLEERAKKVHTLENMMLVPYGYNQARGSRLCTYTSKIKIYDRLDLTRIDFEELIKDCDTNDKLRIHIVGDQAIRKNFKQYPIERYNLEAIKFLLENQKSLMPKIPYCLNMMTGNTLEDIVSRSKSIVNSFNT